MERQHRDIETLLRLAGEVEAMESPSAAPLGRGVSVRGRRRRLARVGVLVASVGLAVVAFSVMRGGPGAGGPGARGVRGPEVASSGVRVEVRDVRTGPGGEPSVTLAIYRGEDGDVRCVQWRAQDWLSNRSASEIDPATPLGLPSEASCRDGGGHVVMVSLSGPLERLPRSDEGARALAQCIVSSKTAQGWMTGQDPCAAVGTALNCCLPMGVQAQVETVAVR
jgi:hypothetical protein